MKTESQRAETAVQTTRDARQQGGQWGHVGIAAVSAARSLKTEKTQPAPRQQSAGVMEFMPDSD